MTKAKDKTRKVRLAHRERDLFPFACIVSFLRSFHGPLQSSLLLSSVKYASHPLKSSDPAALQIGPFNAPAALLSAGGTFILATPFPSKSKFQAFIPSATKLTAFLIAVAGAPPTATVAPVMFKHR
jgi:hypothetical protein